MGPSKTQSLSPTRPPHVEICALDYDQEQVSIDLNAPFSFDEEHTWSNYIRGVIAVLQSRGHALGPCLWLFQGMYLKVQV